MKRFLICVAGGAALFGATPAGAVDLSLGGLVINLCILTPGLGTLGAEADGRTVSSQGLGGIPATIAVVATGSSPTLVFTAPSLTTPAGFSGSPVTMIEVSGSSGILGPYTSAGQTRPLTGLLETVTVRGKATNETGFASGLYTIRTTVTCQQS